VDGFKN